MYHFLSINRSQAVASAPKKVSAIRLVAVTTTRVCQATERSGPRSEIAGYHLQNAKPL